MTCDVKVFLYNFRKVKSTPFMITLITVSDSWNHFTQAIKEYKKRLSKTVRIIEIAPEKSVHPHIIVKKETERIIQCIEKSKGPIFLCDE